MIGRAVLVNARWKVTLTCHLPSTGNYRISNFFFIWLTVGQEKLLTLILEFIFLLNKKFDNFAQNAFDGTEGCILQRSITLALHITHYLGKEPDVPSTSSNRSNQGNKLWFSRNIICQISQIFPNFPKQRQKHKRNTKYNSCLQW